MVKKLSLSSFLPFPLPQTGWFDMFNCSRLTVIGVSPELFSALYKYSRRYLWIQRALSSSTLFSSFQWHTKTLDSIHSSIYSVQFISRETLYYSSVWLLRDCCLASPTAAGVCVCDRTTSSNSESSVSCILISSSFLLLLLLLLLLLYCRARRILINAWTEFPHLVCLSVSNTVGLS